MLRSAMRFTWFLGMVLCVACEPSEMRPDAPPIDVPLLIDVPMADAEPVDARAPDDAPLTGCLAGCAQFNDGASECGVSNYDCDALCAESERIGEDTGCVAETTAFWTCFAAAPRGAYCTAAGACNPERDALDACVALAPSTDCLRACVACGDPSYGTCALGCARRDGQARVLGCEASYAAYYTCRLSGACPICSDETAAFSACWADACTANPERCPVTP